MNTNLLKTTLVLIWFISLESATYTVLDNWFLQEQTIIKNNKQLVIQAYWDTYVIKKSHKHTLIKELLKARCTIKNPEAAIEQAVQTKNFEAFSTLFRDLDDFGVMIITIEEKLNIPFPSYPCKANPTIKQSHIASLARYIKDSNFSGVVSLYQPNNKLYRLAGSVENSTMAFSIHSISKVFTGTLILIMIQENSIKEEWLNQPLQLDPSVKKLLPTSVIEQLQKVTMHQIMLHHGGFGDYTINYFKSLAKAAKNGKYCAPIKKLEEFLRYADSTIIALEDNDQHYSNLGILLLGLSIEHCYNTTRPLDKHLSFEEILHQYIIRPAGMNIFASQRPLNACWNKSGSCSHLICGSPAGGHWTTAEDLQKFGLWFCKKYKEDKEFKRLLERYGGEFYCSNTEELHHTGGIGQPGIGEASARFSLFLRHNISVITLSNQPQMAFKIYNAIYRNIFAETHPKNKT